MRTNMKNGKKRPHFSPIHPLHHVRTPSAAPPAHPKPILHPPTRLRLPAMSRRRSIWPSTRPKWAWWGHLIQRSTNLSPEFIAPPTNSRSRNAAAGIDYRAEDVRLRRGARGRSTTHQSTKGGSKTQASTRYAQLQSLSLYGG